MFANGQSDPALWRFVEPNAGALIGIDWARIRPSRAGAIIREKWLTAGALPAIPGLDLLDNIDRVLISSPGKIPPDDSAQSPILIAIHGRFDAAQVRQVFIRFGAKPQTYNSFQVYRPQGRQAQDMAGVLFDSETILFGDAPSIFAALDRNQFAQASPDPGSLLVRAAEMDANYDVWVMLDAAELTSSDRIAAMFRSGDWGSDAQGFEAGFNLRAGLAADIVVRFSSDAIAKRVTTELTRVVNLAAKDRSTGAQMQNIAKKIKFNVDGSAAKFSLRLTEQELEEGMEAFAISQQAAARSAGLNQKLNEKSNEKSSTNPMPLPARIITPGKPAMIRIEGLDEGTREIPFQDPRH
jgi:hypothetical protein